MSPRGVSAIYCPAGEGTEHKVPLGMLAWECGEPLPFWKVLVLSEVRGAH